jgi:hypothetical protein
MEEVVPELVALVFSHVDRINLFACRFVCTTWMAMIKIPSFGLLCDAHYQELDDSNRMAAIGWLRVLQWARANGCPWDEATCASAAEGGHLEVLQWARSNGCLWDESTCAGAAKGGHLEVR